MKLELIHVDKPDRFLAAFGQLWQLLELLRLVSKEEG